MPTSAFKWHTYEIWDEIWDTHLFAHLFDSGVALYLA